MQHDCVLVKLGQRCGWRRPLHALPVVGHVPHAGKPPLHLPEVSLDLVAPVAAHDGIDGFQSLAPHPGQGAAPHLEVSGKERKRKNSMETFFFFLRVPLSCGQKLVLQLKCSDFLRSRQSRSAESERNEEEARFIEPVR